MLHEGHIRMDFLYTRWSKKLRMIVDTAGYLIFFLPFVGALVWVGVKMAIVSWEIGEVTRSITPLPVYIYKMVIPVGFLLLLVAGVSKVVKGVRFLVGGEEP